MELPDLSLCILKVKLAPCAAVQLPPYLGSTLRGALAMALKRVTCMLRREGCAQCQMRERCWYAQLFETPPDSSLAVWQNRQNWPHPLVLEPPVERHDPWRPEDRLEFRLLLFGRAVAAFPHLTLALQLMAEEGLGRDRARFSVAEIIDEGNAGAERTLFSAADEEGELELPQTLTTGHLIADLEQPPAKITIRLETPLRLISHQQLVRELDFPVLVKALLGRITSLASFHCGVPAELDFHAILERAVAVRRVSSEYAFTPLARWSNRQEQQISLGGLLGTVSYSGGDLGYFHPLLRLGEYTHVGKGTIFGLGKIRVATEDAKRD